MKYLTPRRIRHLEDMMLESTAARIKDLTEKNQNVLTFNIQEWIEYQTGFNWACELEDLSRWVKLGSADLSKLRSKFSGKLGSKVCLIALVYSEDEYDNNVDYIKEDNNDDTYEQYIANLFYGDIVPDAFDAGIEDGDFIVADHCRVVKPYEVLQSSKRLESDEFDPNDCSLLILPIEFSCCH